MSAYRTRLAAVAFLLLVSGSTPAVASGARQYFEQLREVSGITPVAQLVCYPDAGQGQDSEFWLVAFSKDMAARLRAKGMPVSDVLQQAAKAPEAQQAILEWSFDHGVRMHRDPEVLAALSGSKGAMWTGDDGTKNGKTITVRVTFAQSGRYSRTVFVDGVAALSVYGQCDAIE